MEFDARHLAPGWLAVSLAASTDNQRPALNKTVHVEAYPEGVRLTSTDSYMVLSCWVPSDDDHMAPEPDVDDAPYATAVAYDEHGRAKGLLAHLLKLAAADEDTQILVRVNLGVTDNGPDVGGALPIEGLEASYVTIEHPDHERVKLRTIESPFPDWRRLVTSWRGQQTIGVALNTEIMGRLAKLGKGAGERGGVTGLFTTSAATSCAFCNKPFVPSKQQRSRLKRGISRVLYCSQECAGKRHGTPEERFWSRIDRAGPLARNAADLGACWLWTGARDCDGYALFTIHDRLVRVSRWVVETFHGPLTPAMQVDHFACDNPPCVNPDHRRPATGWENTLRNNGPTAWNKAKTQCAQGHPFDKANTYVTPSGKRICRTCRRASRQRRVGAGGNR